MIYSSAETAPARVAALVRAVQVAGPLAGERLEALLQPPSVREGGTTATRDNLKLAIELGLVREEGGLLHASEQRNSVSTYDDVLKDLSTHVLGKKLPPVDGAAPHEYYQFARLVAWYLDQPLTRGPTLPQVQERWPQIAEPNFRELDKAGFERFLLWATALGVLHRLNVGRQQAVHLIVVNPTPFLRRHLKEVVSDDKSQPALDWLRTLGEQFPVFDRGWIRQRLRPIEDQILTPSLSLAMRQLAAENLLVLEDRKDAPRLRLRVGKYEQQFTHIGLGQGGAA